MNNIVLGDRTEETVRIYFEQAQKPAIKAMLSYCVFDKSSWNKGIATDASLLFLEEIKEKFNLESIGAFTYSDNLASIKVLEKVGFDLVESFEEDGRESKYFQRNY